MFCNKFYEIVYYEEKGYIISMTISSLILEENQWPCVFYTNAQSVIGIEKVYKDEIYINSEKIGQRKKDLKN